MMRLLYDLRLDYQYVPLCTRLWHLARAIALLLALVGWVVVSGYWTGALP
jgi:hypothetical protein